MTTKFQARGINYTLLVSPRGRRETEEGVEIRPNPEMWTSSQKRHSGLFTTGVYAEEGHRSQRSLRKRRGPVVNIKPVRAEQFLESAPAE